MTEESQEEKYDALRDQLRDLEEENRQLREKVRRLEHPEWYPRGL